MVLPVHLLIAEPVDPSTGDPVPVYLSDVGFTSKKTDTPSSTTFPPDLLQPFSYDVLGFGDAWPGTGSSSQSIGVISINNGEGDYASLLGLRWEGVPVQLIRTTQSSSVAGGELVFQGTAERISADGSILTIALTGARERMNVPLLTTTFAGDGEEEGDSAMEGQTIPLALGEFENVQLVMIDSANLVYRVGLSPVESISAVRDRGAVKTPTSDHADWAALLGASLSGSEYATCLALGLVRLGGVSPSGTVTCDGGGYAGGDDGYVATLAGIAKLLTHEFLGDNSLLYPSGYDTDALTALASAQPAVVNHYVGMNDGQTVADALDRILGGAGCWWIVKPSGQFFVSQLVVPSGDPAVTLTPGDVLRNPDIAVENLTPAWRWILGSERRWTVQDGDALADSVTAADRRRYSNEWTRRERKNDAIKAAAPKAADQFVETPFSDADDAATEAARLRTLHAGGRQRVRVALAETGPGEIGDPFTVPFGQVIRLQGFAGRNWGAYKDFVCIGCQVDVAARSTVWVLWG